MKKARPAGYRTEYLTFRIRVDLHDRVRDAATAEAKATGENPERHKTAWLTDAINEKLKKVAT